MYKHINCCKIQLKYVVDHSNEQLINSSHHNMYYLLKASSSFSVSSNSPFSRSDSDLGRKISSVIEKESKSKQNLEIILFKQHFRNFYITTGIDKKKTIFECYQI